MAKELKIMTVLFNFFLSEKAKEKSERIILMVAILSFLLHLGLILLVDAGLIDVPEKSKLLRNPIAAIYTPFSFILIYEVYLLVFYLPYSITTYIGKQYEIITLIVIRRIFKDMANLDLTQSWFQDKYDLQFTYDIIATLLLFFLIFLFNWLNNRRIKAKKTEIQKVQQGQKLAQFIQLKKSLSTLLIPIFLGLALFSLGKWIYESFFSISEMVNNIRDVNQVFFDDFFTLLILTDVLLLLISFVQTDDFRKVIRNSGFVISTILLKISFSTSGFLNTALIVSAVAFGVLILWIHNLYDRLES